METQVETPTDPKVANPAPKVYVTPRAIWSHSERDMFRHVKATHVRAKIELPKALTAAIDDGDLRVVVDQIDAILDSDIVMTDKLRNWCNLWIDRRRPSR